MHDGGFQFGSPPPGLATDQAVNTGVKPPSHLMSLVLSFQTLFAWHSAHLIITCSYCLNTVIRISYVLSRQCLAIICSYVNPPCTVVRGVRQLNCQTLVTVSLSGGRSPRSDSLRNSVVRPSQRATTQISRKPAASPSRGYSSEKPAGRLACCSSFRFVTNWF